MLLERVALTSQEIVIGITSVINTDTCTSVLLATEHPLEFQSDPGTNQSEITVSMHIMVAAYECIVSGDGHTLSNRYNLFRMGVS